MAEYWKSTPKYWCKHCATYVRDTKLDRTNHEATGKHKGAVERALRDLHRNHDKQEREKERARREIERLNGVVSTADEGPARGGGRARTGAAQPAEAAAAAAVSKEQRQAQLEQLAEMGVSIPDELRGQLAMAGEWTVTRTRVVEDGGGGGDGGGTGSAAVARGVRKRELDKTEEEKAEESAVEGLFKKPRRWGRDTKVADEDDGGELDALLSGSTFVVKKPEDEHEDEHKHEHEHENDVKSEQVKGEHGAEAEDNGGGVSAPVKREDTLAVKEEPGDDQGSGVDAAVAPRESANPVVVFKKRKPKNVRQK